MQFVEYPDQDMMMIDLAQTLAGEPIGVEEGVTRREQSEHRVPEFRHQEELVEEALLTAFDESDLLVQSGSGLPAAHRWRAFVDRPKTPLYNSRFTASMLRKLLRRGRGPRPGRGR